MSKTTLTTATLITHQGNYGREDLLPILADALAMLGHTPETSIRAVVGSHTIVAQREHGQAVAVAITTSDPVMKSIHRMIRRAARTTAAPEAVAA